MFRHRILAALATVSIVWLAGCESDSDPVAPPNIVDSASESIVELSLGDYEFEPLDVPVEMGSFTSAFGINSWGTITGNFAAPDGTAHGFLVRRGVFTDVTVPGAGGTFLGSLGDINEFGVAVGLYSDADDVGHIFLRFADGRITKLPDPVPNALDSDGTGINNFGTIVGTYFDAEGKIHGFIRRFGHYETYDYPGATVTRVNGINDRGQMAGQWSAAGRSHGFILEDGETQPIEFPGAVSTRATCINNRGMVAGFYNNADGVFHGFVYRDGEFATVDFPGALDSAAFGINDAGVIVGTYDDFSRGFVARPQRHKPPVG